MRLEKTIFVLCLIFILTFIFITGIQVGKLLKSEKAVEENYFDTLPSPLACHADNSCSLKE